MRDISPILPMKEAHLSHDVQSFYWGSVMWSCIASMTSLGYLDSRSPEKKQTFTRMPLGLEPAKGQF